MPHLFIILSLQGTDSFSLFKFDLLTSPLACNLEIVWVVHSMKDTGCHIITLYYRLRCQQPARKLHLTCHYFCWPFACEEHWATQPQPNWTSGHARTIHCQVREASTCSDGACALTVWQECKSASRVSIWPGNWGCLPLAGVPTSEQQASQSCWKSFDADINKCNNISLVSQRKYTHTCTYIHAHTCAGTHSVY